MEIAHTGRTGRDTSITFNTEKKIFCFGREKHDVYMYAERTRDVIGVIKDLARAGFIEVGREEFKEV